MQIDSDLIAYYEAEAQSGRRSVHGQFRADLRRTFADRLRGERRRHLLDVGAGPGLDTVAWHHDGFDVVGVDLAHANVAKMHERNLPAVTGSLYDLPFRTGTFEVLWTMSTFVHVPHDRFDDAIGEMLRVVRPGGLLGIGTWGGIDFEGVPEFGDLQPFRFFSLAAHDRWRSMLASHGDVEAFETYDPGDEHGWHYQFAVLRRSP
jgi:SAM-dependent methyltransferase